VNFAVSTGTVIPPTVTLVDVPAEVVRIVPAWRSYKVVRVKNQILVVEPSSRKIVEVITIRSWRASWVSERRSTAFLDSDVRYRDLGTGLVQPFSQKGRAAAPFFFEKSPTAVGSEQMHGVGCKEPDAGENGADHAEADG
jgi:hypothetical protein